MSSCHDGAIKVHLADHGCSSALHGLNLLLGQAHAAETKWQLVAVHELALCWGNWAKFTASDVAENVTLLDGALQWAVLLGVLAVGSERWGGVGVLEVGWKGGGWSLWVRLAGVVDRGCILLV